TVPSCCASRLAVCDPAPGTRLPGPAPGACFAGPHSPWSLPFAPPAPPRLGPHCSPASSLLFQGLTSRVRASSATAPRLPDAGRTTRGPPGRTRDLPGSDLLLLYVMGSWTTTECRRLAWRHRTYCLRRWGRPRPP